MVLLSLKSGELATEWDETPLVLDNDADESARRNLVAEAHSAERPIAIPFPKFNDGRGFSQANVARRQYGFTGELRAIGDAIPDQALHLLRAGFDTVVIPDEAVLPTWQRALKRYRGGYQTALRNPFQLRQRYSKRDAPERNVDMPMHSERDIVLLAAHAPQ